MTDTDADTPTPEPMATPGLPDAPALGASALPDGTYDGVAVFVTGLLVFLMVLALFAPLINLVTVLT